MRALLLRSLALSSVRLSFVCLSFSLPMYVCMCIRADANADRMPIFVISDFDPQDTSQQQHYEEWPWGSARRVVPRNNPPFTLQQWVELSARALSNFTSEEANKIYPADSWERVLMLDHWEDRHRRAWCVVCCLWFCLFATFSLSMMEIVGRCISDVCLSVCL